MGYAGIITAAGLSSRMGAFKPLLEINGLPMIAHTVMSMKNVGLSPVCIVTGYRGEEIQKALADYDILFAENKDFATTDMLSSIKLGIEKVKESDGFFLLPGDMPLIPPETFNAVQNTSGSYIVPTVNGRNAHPPLIKKECYDAILSFTGDGGLPKALADFEKTYVETGNEDSNRDADFRHEFDIVAQIGKKALGLSEKLCNELFEIAKTPQHIRNHGVAVGKLSERMAKKLSDNGYFTNILLCKSAGTLHDILRLEKMHSEAGADFLKKQGYDAVSQIVRRHMTSEGLDPVLNEASIVFLADKLIRETERVSPKERYAPAFEKFPEGTETGNRIRKDCSFSELLLNKYIELTGDVI